MATTRHSRNQTNGGSREEMIGKSSDGLIVATDFSSMVACNHRQYATHFRSVVACNHRQIRDPYKNCNMVAKGTSPDFLFLIHTLVEILTPSRDGQSSSTS